MTPALWTLLGVVVTALVGYFGQRRLNASTAKKAEAEAGKIVQEMYLSLLTPMQSQIDQLRAENTYFAAEMAALKSRLGMVEDDRDTLAASVRVIAEWDDAGQPDPPGFPGVASNVRAILHRLHSAA